MTPKQLALRQTLKALFFGVGSGLLFVLFLNFFGLMGTLFVILSALLVFLLRMVYTTELDKQNRILNRKGE